MLMILTCMKKSTWPRTTNLHEKVSLTVFFNRRLGRGLLTCMKKSYENRLRKSETFTASSRDLKVKPMSYNSDKSIYRNCSGHGKRISEYGNRSLVLSFLSIQGGAKSAHEHGQGAELGPPYSKGVLNQHMNTGVFIQGLDTATVLI
ncbi:hypothetical protein J6590_044996 [Homalodisca vitripennis]|nr:hypothetical protein J6590_044996 [Homalodisca vitripennis]